MVILYGTNRNEAINNGPVRLRSMDEYRAYKATYSYVEIISD